MTYKILNFYHSRWIWTLLLLKFQFNSRTCWLFPCIRNVIGEIRSNPIQLLVFITCTEKENENLFTVAFLLLLKESICIYTLNNNPYFFRKNTLDFIVCTRKIFNQVCLVKRRVLCVYRKNSFDNCFPTFRARTPKIFYVSTSETSTTLSTHTVCYVSSTANAACTGKKRRCVLGFIAPLLPLVKLQFQ